MSTVDQGPDSGRRRVLFVSPFFPADARTNVNGAFQRMRLYVDAFSGVARLDFLFYVQPGLYSGSLACEYEARLNAEWDVRAGVSLCARRELSPQASRWKRYGSGAVSFFNLPGYYEMSGEAQIRAFEACLTRRPDLIFAHRLSAMCPVMRTDRPLPPVLLDLDDVEHVALHRAMHNEPDWRTKLLHLIRLPALRSGEEQALRNAFRTFVCSEDDQKYLEQRWRLNSVRVVPNAVAGRPPSPLCADRTLLFLGSFRYAPNVQAARFLLEQVWPEISREVPDARLILAGVAPERVPGYGSGLPRVTFAGFVDDLSSLYQGARVACAPIFVGGGTRIKIIEAASYAKPIVATALGAEGLSMRDGVELLLRDGARGFAQACIQLLRDDVLCRRIGSTAHAHVSRHFDRAAVVSQIQRLLLSDCWNQRFQGAGPARERM